MTSEPIGGKRKLEGPTKGKSCRQKFSGEHIISFEHSGRRVIGPVNLEAIPKRYNFRVLPKS